MTTILLTTGAVTAVRFWAAPSSEVDSEAEAEADSAEAVSAEATSVAEEREASSDLQSR